MREDLFWLGFSAFPGVGPKKFAVLLATFGSACGAWNGETRVLSEVLGEKLASKFIDFRQTFSPEAYAQKLISRHIAYVLLKDDTYPHLLQQISTAPFVLYIKGNKQLVSDRKKHTIGIVGARRHSMYGLEVTQKITTELVQSGVVIVSGLALGIDAIAHETTIDLGGETIAVLGCGVDCCTPYTNQKIYDRILEQGGAIVSESAFGMGASKGIFPSRNRIIAGLSEGVVVTEGSEDSGALITAENAKKFARPVFAVPGPITSNLAGGPMKLLHDGAKVIGSGQDVLMALGLDSISYNRTALPEGDTKTEQAIIDALSKESMYLDMLARNLNQDSASISSTLSEMELKGVVRSIGGKFSL